jgi:6,7-dimethyl-8-ribityllumazine synthase
MSKPILLVVAPYYKDITDALLQGATDALETAGWAHETLEVPGAFEIPQAIALAECSGTYAGYIALGCVVRGETSHYDYVCGESARALMDLGLDGLAIGYGILTVESQAQAIARADIAQKNKGGEAAHACLTMIGLHEKFGISGHERAA